MAFIRTIPPSDADTTFNDLDPALRQALTVGRPVADR
jgi:hypothetical protein